LLEPRVTRAVPSSVRQVLLWGLRLLAYAEERGGLDGRCALEGEWLRVLDLSGRREEGLADKQVRDALRKRLKRAERIHSEGEIDRAGVLFENIRALASELALTRVEEDLVGFAVAAHCEPLLQQAFEHVGRDPASRTYDLLAAVLHCSSAEVRSALGRGGILAASGLVRVGPCPRYGHKEPIRTAYGFPELLAREHEAPADLLACFHRPARAAQLSRSDYESIAADIDVLVKLVQKAGECGTRGVNILFHGRPGTGKTELARVVAREIGARLYEVNVEDDDGDAISRESRLAAYMLSQRLLSRRRGQIVLFDELEDVFPRKGRAQNDLHDSGRDKGWTSRMLEENVVPTIWTGNEVEHIDPAFLRRFDFALELRAPPLRTRKRILERYTRDLPVRPAFIERAALDERLTPAHVERASRVARLCASASPEEAEATVGRVLNHSLALVAKRGSVTRGARLSQDPTAIDIGILHTNIELARVIEGIRKQRSGSICLFGPPGTGKTAFANYLAQAADLPIHVRRASDLLSPWVGETEQNLAEMFRRAEDESAFIFLDEADSFLRARARSSHAWEVTQVNELLVQMEAFAGVFVCATNIIDDLDEASLRRFSMKIRFDPPRAEQRWQLFRSALRELGVSGDVEDAEHARRVVDKLDGLTPGDFVVVTKRAKLLDKQLNATELCAALAEELRFKSASARTIGFEP
jgi:transitional endoplasmic reticulum ATPase